jgi:hypothetical protein
MFDVNKEGILEVFDFRAKNVLCCSFDATHIIGLINRGAIIWFEDKDKQKVYELEAYPSFKNSINFVVNNRPNLFDYSMVSDINHGVLEKNRPFFVKEHIVTLAGKFNVIKWHLFSHRLFLTDDRTLYSVVPSLDNVRLVIPELFEISFQRYWTLRCPNPLGSLKLTAEWLFIKSGLFRKLFFDKLIVIKC